MKEYCSCAWQSDRAMLLLEGKELHQVTGDLVSCTYAGTSEVRHVWHLASADTVLTVQLP